MNMSYLPYAIHANGKRQNNAWDRCAACGGRCDRERLPFNLCPVGWIGSLFYSMGPRSASCRGLYRSLASGFYLLKGLNKLDLIISPRDEQRLLPVFNNAFNTCS